MSQMVIKFHMRCHVVSQMECQLRKTDDMARFAGIIGHLYNYIMSAILNN